MPVRDGARFLDEAICSIVTGEWEDFELIAVDDGSVDSTPAILAGWAARDPRIRVVTLDRPHGEPGARNRGLAVARGTFLAPHDADDVFVPARLGAQVAALQADPGTALVSGGAEFIDARGRRLFTRVLDQPPEVIEHVLPFGNPLIHGSAMFRREDLLALGGWAEEMVGSCDYDLFLRLATLGRPLAVPLVWLRCRRHTDQLTARHGADQRAQSIANTRRVLPAALGRELDRAEADAAANVWRETGADCDLAAADALLREALARSPHAGEADFRRRVATIAAEHWVGHASRHALGGRVLEAVRCLHYAARWHPRGALGAADLTLRRIGWMAAVRFRELT
jgi:glycosyltransferase involved in cell wall biosynthesis